MKKEERDVEVAVEEDVFRQEAPVDSPLKQELTSKVK